MIFIVQIKMDYEENGFHWNEIEQGHVLGSFYWMHWILQLPGGILGRRYGSKIIFGFANFSGAFLGFLMPLASYYDVNYLIFLRVLQGMITVNFERHKILYSVILHLQIFITRSGPIVACNA